jgi:hypothetical protein
MKSEDLVKQMVQVIPGQTDLFSTVVAVQSSSYVPTGGGAKGGIVTVVAASHGLVTGSEVRIVGNEKFPLDTLTFLDGVVTATTVNNHDLTLGDPAFPNVTIEGVDLPEYNGTFELIGRENRKTFNYPIDSTPAGAGSGGYLIDPQQLAFGQVAIVTVIDQNTFTYAITSDPKGEPNIALVSTLIRISRAATVERAVRSYTAQDNQNLWAFVILDDKSTSKDRDIFSDATNQQARGQTWQIRRIEPFSVYILAPNTDQIAGAENMDLMESVEKYLTKSLAGYLAPTVYSQCPQSGITPIGSGYFGTAAEGEEAAGPGVYIHRFQYERIIDITKPDTVDPKQSHSWLDTDVKQNDSDSGATNFEWLQNQDENPLP